MNEYQSKNIINGQAEVHKNLQKIVKKHIDCDYKKPMQQHNVVAVETLKKVIAQQKKSELLLDSCCGTGLSSIALAKMYPDSLVVGVDQSGVRLSKDYQNIVRPPTYCYCRRIAKIFGDCALKKIYALITIPSYTLILGPNPNILSAVGTAIPYFHGWRRFPLKRIYAVIGLYIYTNFLAPGQC